MLKAVLFDLDNTLLDRERVFRACLQADGALTEAAVQELLQLDEAGHGDRETLFAAWQRHRGAPMSQAVLNDLMMGHIQPDLELLAALADLGSSNKLGMVTNGGSDTQRRKLKASGLDTVIPPEHTLVSSEVGVWKPDPRIFWMASQALGVEPGECLFVGDQERFDGVGARAAGMELVLVEAVLTADGLRALL